MGGANGPMVCVDSITSFERGSASGRRGQGVIVRGESGGELAARCVPAFSLLVSDTPSQVAEALPCVSRRCAQGVPEPLDRFGNVITGGGGLLDVEAPPRRRAAHTLLLQRPFTLGYISGLVMPLLLPRNGRFECHESIVIPLAGHRRCLETVPRVVGYFVLLIEPPPVPEHVLVAVTCVHTEVIMFHGCIVVLRCQTQWRRSVGGGVPGGGGSAASTAARRGTLCEPLGGISGGGGGGRVGVVGHVAAAVGLPPFPAPRVEGGCDDEPLPRQVPPVRVLLKQRVPALLDSAKGLDTSRRGRGALASELGSAPIPPGPTSRAENDGEAGLSLTDVVASVGEGGGIRLRCLAAALLSLPIRRDRGGSDVISAHRTPPGVGGVDPVVLLALSRLPLIDGFGEPAHILLRPGEEFHGRNDRSHDVAGAAVVEGDAGLRLRSKGRVKLHRLAGCFIRRIVPLDVPGDIRGFVARRLSVRLGPLDGGGEPPSLGIGPGGQCEPSVHGPRVERPPGRARHGPDDIETVANDACRALEADEDDPHP